MLRELSLIFEIIPTVFALFSVIVILRRNLHNIVNILMASGLGFIGLYTLFIFIYDLIGTAVSIRIFLPLAMSSILIGSMLVYFALSAIVHSPQIFEDRIRWVPFTLISIGYSIFLNLYKDMITIISYVPVNTQISLVPLIILVLMVYGYLGGSYFILQRFIKSNVSPDSNTRLKIFANGILIGLFAVTINVASQIVSNELVSIILDIVYFGILSITLFVLFMGFVYKRKN